MKQRALPFLLAAVLTLALAPAAWAAEAFTDVPSTHWAYDDIQACAEQGIVTGFADGSFKPGDNVTGVQFIVMMTRTFHAGRLDNVVTPAGQPWYYANTKVAEDVSLSDGLTIDENPMNRYNMAQALYNEICVNDLYNIAVGKPSIFDNVDTLAAKTALKDYSSMTKKQQTWVRNCYALGILSDMSDGTFSGEANMTRAQACAVFIRMMDLINGAAPVTPTQPEQPQQPVQPQQPEAPAETGNGKLANGEDATVANVQAILDDLKNKYPNGTIWGTSDTPNTNAYAGGTGSVDVKAIPEIASTRINTRYACGGWAAMVSDTIFGQSGAPARRVTKTSDLRPGDIVLTITNKTGLVSHVAIFTGISASGNIVTCDGNVSGTVLWGASSRNLENLTGSSHAIAYTRYPE